MTEQTPDINTGKYVSIHTPTQGVTNNNGGLQMYMGVSIHTPTQGVTHCRHFLNGHSRFQSTHPRRVWPYRIFKTTCKWSFNPHTHAGCDADDEPCEYFQEVSIHTPTQGVTSFICLMQPNCEFQSTHPRRVWLWDIAQHVFFGTFQSTHPRRVWLIEIITFQSLWCFNPHTHAGCDPALA